MEVDDMTAWEGAPTPGQGTAPPRPDLLRPDLPHHGLDQSCMGHLLGYHITQANVSSRKVFARHIGGPYKLSPVEFTILMLIAYNRDATQKQLSLALAVSAPNVTTCSPGSATRPIAVRSMCASRARGRRWCAKCGRFR